MWAKKLVRRTDVEVCPEFGHVDEFMRCMMDTIHPGQSTSGVRRIGNRPNRRLGANQVRCPSDCDDSRLWTKHRIEGRHVDLTGLRIKLKPPHLCVDCLGGLYPRPDIGVVIEARDDHFVARTPPLREVAREVIDDLRGTAPVDNAPWVNPEEVSESLPEGDDGVVSIPFRQDRTATVRKRTRQGGRNCLADLTRRLGASRPIKVGNARSERWELRSQICNVEGHHFTHGSRSREVVSILYGSVPPAVFTVAPSVPGRCSARARTLLKSWPRQ